jgi:hypothetical protein
VERRGECPECEANLANRPEPAAMTGDERAAELLDDLMGENCYLFDNIHKRVEALVGRPVWTHEMAAADNLAKEARTWQHPVDLEAHVIGSLDQLMGDKPVVIVRPGEGDDEVGYEGSRY